LCIEKGSYTIAEGYQLPISFTFKDGKPGKCPSHLAYISALDIKKKNVLIYIGLKAE
jgi:hypothetical protein